jgi:outer membrane protein
MKKLLVLVVSSLLLVTANVAAANTNVGVIDVQKIVQQSPEIAKMKKTLKKELAPEQQKLVAAQKTFKKDLQVLNKNSAVMSKSQRKKLMDKITKKQAEFRALGTKIEQAAYNAQNTTLRALLKKVKTQVAKIAKRRHLDLVVSKNGVAYMNDNLDITAEVLKAIK